jgi:DNA-binding CsgD family transcriptional regulator
MCSFSGTFGLSFVPQLPPSAMPPASVLAQMSDALPWPLLLLRRDAVLVHANLAARQLLHRGQPLKLDERRRVQAGSAAQQAAFAAALQAGEPALLQWPSAVAPPPGHAGCSVTFRPLGAAGVGPDDAPVLVLIGTGTARHADLQAFARLHGLSPAETRVLERLSLGDSATDAAAALGTKTTTVRSQVASLRRKAGCASVAGLLRALATMPPAATLHLVQPPREGVGE